MRDLKPRNTCDQIKILRSARRAQGIPQEALAKKVGVAKCMIMYWETGKCKPGLGLFLLWAQALGFSVALIPEKVSVKEDKL